MAKSKKKSGKSKDDKKDEKKKARKAAAKKAAAKKEAAKKEAAKKAKLKKAASKKAAPRRRREEGGGEENGSEEGGREVTVCQNRSEEGRRTAACFEGAECACGGKQGTDVDGDTEPRGSSGAGARCPAAPSDPAAATGAPP